MLADTSLKQTPLYDTHLQLKARMVPFGGWQMPVQYEGILAEYAHTRQGVTVFDTCHMGEFLIEGDYRKSGLDRLVTCRLSDLPKGSCRYGLLLNDEGGVLDDLIVYWIGEQQWMIVVNASTMENDARQFQAQLDPSATFHNVSFLTGKLDIQGPLSREVLKPLVAGIEKLEYYTFDYFPVLGERVIISRTGYTGELGYEIYFPWDRTPELWSAIFADPRVAPAGLGVRDVLRLEMGYSLYGHELNETISPLAAGLGKFVDLEKDFIGREALLKQKSDGLKTKLVCFKSNSRRSPRQHHRIFSAEGRQIGEVTSGTFSPAIETGIGMGFVEPDHAKPGQTIFFGQAEAREAAVTCNRPFYSKGSLKT